MGQAGSWIKHGLDVQERQLVAALTREEQTDRCRRAFGAGRRGQRYGERSPIPRGDYRQFYVQLRDAVHGVGSNPVPPAQVIPVIAVVETAIRSSAEGRALTLPLTDEEALGFNRIRPTR